jgi:hypothetical protein
MPSAPEQGPWHALMSRPARLTNGWGTCETGCARLDGTPAWRLTPNGWCWDSFERRSWLRSRTSGSSMPCDRDRARSVRSPPSRRRRGSWSSTTLRIRRLRRPTGGWSGCSGARTRQGSRVSSAKPSARRRPREANRHADVRGTRISNTSGIRGAASELDVVSRIGLGRIGQRRATRIHPYRERDCDRSTYWHFPCWYAGASHRKDPYGHSCRGALGLVAGVVKRHCRARRRGSRDGGNRHGRCANRRLPRACSRLSVEGAVGLFMARGGVTVRLVLYGPIDPRCPPFGRWRDRGHVTMSYWRHLAPRDPASSPKRPAVRSHTAPPPNP